MTERVEDPSNIADEPEVASSCALDGYVRASKRGGRMVTLAILQDEGLSFEVDKKPVTANSLALAFYGTCPDCTMVFDGSANIASGRVNSISFGICPKK